MISRILLYFGACGVALLTACGGGPSVSMVGDSSGKTGERYGGTKDEEGFNPIKYKGQEAAPGLVFIEGGTYHAGGSEKDIAYAMDNRERQVTVHSFYMDETEVANVDWKEFLFHNRDQSEDSIKKLLPDTTVWFRELAYNEPFVEWYYQHPAFLTYPVVGVTWFQANAYTKWRTSFVNGKTVAKAKEGSVTVLNPEYRLPTESEWEYAARGLLEQELYPWEGKSLRNGEGMFYANFKRGRGDYAGRSNKGGSPLPDGLNDRYTIPAPVREYWPNDFGLFNMAGNVAEWTSDTYRVLAFEDYDDFQSFRRRGSFTSGRSGLKPGNNSDLDRLEKTINTEDRLERDTEYSTNKNAKMSVLYDPDQNDPSAGDHDRMKVYRGGAWNDVAYYLTTGTRRTYQADSSASFIGFRCCMMRVGSPSLDY